MYRGLSKNSIQPLLTTCPAIGGFVWRPNFAKLLNFKPFFRLCGAPVSTYTYDYLFSKFNIHNAEVAPDPLA